MDNSAFYNIDQVIVILKDQLLGNEIIRDSSDATGNFPTIDLLKLR